ncbi:MAG: hypothetical protein ACXVIY_00950 [Mucilaginibacter sp.]
MLILLLIVAIINTAATVFTWWMIVKYTGLLHKDLVEFENMISRRIKAFLEVFKKAKEFEKP